MKNREIERLMARLGQPELSLAEAEAMIGELDGREVIALPAVFRTLHDATTPATINAAVQVLRRWVDLPLAAALPNALRALIQEDDVPDLNKIAAAGLLALLGAPLDDLELAEALDDPGTVVAESLADGVAATASPTALVQFLDALVGWSAAALIDLCHDLAALDDAAAGRILGPLALMPDRDVAIAALAAIEQLGARSAIGALQAAVRAHPDDDVRRQAAQTLRRLPAAVVRAVFPSDTMGTAQPLADERIPSGEPSAWMSGGADRRAVILARRAGATDAHDVFTAVVNDSGIATYAAAERVGDEGLAFVRARLAAGGLMVSEVDPIQAEAVLSTAVERTVAAGEAVSVGYAGWWAWSSGGGGQ
ncbi:MAG: hypothetical protein ABI780_06925 [Ardenticatenales bacterium]